MTIESLPGSVTAPDPLEVENDALRAEVERLKRTVEVYEAALPFWPFQMREFIRMGDVEGMKAEAARRQVWVAEVHTDRHNLREQVATLTAERDTALQLAGERAFAKAMEIYGDAQRAEQVGHAARGPLTRGDKP